MYEPRGKSLLVAVSILTSLGFMLIGFDNGLMGGLVDTPAFNTTFNNPNSTMTGLIVAIYEGMSRCLATHFFLLLTNFLQSAVSWARARLPLSVNVSVVAKRSLSALSSWSSVPSCRPHPTRAHR